MCPQCGREARCCVYRGVVPYCTACGALRGPLTGPSVNMAGKPSRVGATFATVLGWLVLAVGGSISLGVFLLFLALEATTFGLAISLPMLLLVLVAGVALVRSGSSLGAKATRVEQSTRDQALLAMAAHKGAVTATDAAQALGIGVAEADARLTSLAKRAPERVAVDVDDQGLIWYRTSLQGPGSPSRACAWLRTRVSACLPPPRSMPPMKSRVRSLRVLHGELDGCRACPKMIGPVVHGPPVDSRVMLVGQAPGPREGSFGRPFAWTAGRTMFGWFHESLGMDEASFRSSVYMAAIARCFPGKASEEGPAARRRRDRALQDVKLEREVDILRPDLVIAVGTLAIEQVLGEKAPLADVVGKTRRARWYGRELDVVALPHPSGASPWHRTEPGKTILRKALRRLAKHPAMRGLAAAEEGT